MISVAHREQTVMMARIRNEGRWIRRGLERTWQVAAHVVLWDDGSTDETMVESVASLGPLNQLAIHRSAAGPTLFVRKDSTFLHYVRSPFRLADPRPALARYQVNEIRDKNALWEYVKARVACRYILCLDGDEMLSQQFIDRADATWAALDAECDILHLPFVYLWDSLEMRRVDGIYGDMEYSNFAKLNFPRLFTTQRWTEQEIFDSHFDWQGSKGGFHCGSIPRAQARDRMSSGNVHAPVVHFGYIDDELRRTKFEFYNRIDPGNVVEGEYKHIIGEPDIHAPGPVLCVPWTDLPWTPEPAELPHEGDEGPHRPEAGR